MHLGLAEQSDVVQIRPPMCLAVVTQLVTRGRMRGIGATVGLTVPTLQVEQCIHRERVKYRVQLWAQQFGTAQTVSDARIRKMLSP